MRIFSLSVLLLISVSCSVIDVSSEYIDLGDPETARSYIAFHGKVNKDLGIDEWQRPSTTVRFLTGDCEDFAGLYVSAIRAYGGAATLVAGWYDGPVGEGWHMAVRYNNELISPQFKENFGRMCEGEFTVWIEYTFEEYLRGCVK
jgi:hypothetical protein